MIMAITIGVMVTAAVYLMQQRGMVRIVLGMQLLGHSANLMLLATGVGAWRGEVFPFRADFWDETADPLPQAFVLTAIVISMATTTILLTMAALGASDDTVVTDLVAKGGKIRSPLNTIGRATQSAEEYEAGQKVRAQTQQRQIDNKEGRN